MSYFLGIDFGGTRVKIGLVNNNYTVVKKLILPVEKNPHPVKMVKKISEQIKSSFSRYKIVRAGCGICGDIDHFRGVVRFSPNLNWKNVFWRSYLEKSLSLPVKIENDANAAAWGVKIKKFPGAKNLIGITLGTGIGGGIICDGKIYRGSSGSAGEIGHINIEPDGRKCNCGSFGCLEAYIGAGALSRYAKEKAKSVKNSVLNQYLEITPEIIYRAAVSGDKLAKEIFDYMGKILGIALSDIINVFNPEIIVLMGGVSRAKKFFLKTLKQTVKQRTYQSAYRTVRIVSGKQDDEPGVIGAAFLHLSD